uniref:Nucleocapsid protein n=1 Tax=Coleopteran phasma-related virus OKIAV236 TaxID=2746310 RepID=A0A7D7J414_9VIRU|nr:nucleocapsid protein [Coleopteran phasma-related virus OKIAV236]
MALQTTTLSARDVCAALSIEYTSQANDEFEVAGASPNELLSHTVSRTYTITGMTPEDFIKKHGSVEFDLIELQRQFKTICHDYGDSIGLTTMSMAVDFCSKVIYEIGPDSRKGKKGEDKIWKLRFPYKVENNLKVATLFIATYRNSEYKSNYEPGKRLCITVKQAGLLAMDTFNTISVLGLSCTPPVYLLTPLAGAVYSRVDIESIATTIDTTPAAVLITINSSCQSGGHYLSSSRLHIAVIAAIVATRNIKSEQIKHSIIGKTIKQYLSVGKEWLPNKYEAYGSFAHGGVPSDLKPQILMDIFDRVQKISPRQAIQAAAQTVMESTIAALPGTSRDADHKDQKKKK